MKTMLGWSLVALLPAGVLGCGTLFAPGPDEIDVSTHPPGAMVRLDGMEVGTTPCVVSVPRSSEGVFTFELAGFETATVDRDKVCNGFTALNLLGGYVTMPLFFAIDILSGNVGKYSTKPIRVKLKPAVPPVRPTPIGRADLWRRPG